MRIALHPYKEKNITVEDYLREFGRRPLWNNNDARPAAQCPFCRKELVIRASSTPQSTGHFAHQQHSGPCPVKTMNAKPYLNFLPHHPDKTHARFLKQQFFRHWQQHYYLMNRLTKNLQPPEFEKLLHQADNLRIWEYSGLQEHEIPYVLCTLADFPPQAKNENEIKEKPWLRRCWFRFWFDSPIEDFNHLWIEGNRPTGYWITYYRPPIGKKRIPGIDDLINSYKQNIQQDFLTQPVKLSQYIERKISPLVQRYNLE